MEPTKCQRALKCAICSLFFFLCTALPSRSQSTNSEIDKLFELATGLQNTNLDSSYALAGLIGAKSKLQKYEKGEIESKLLAAYYFWDKNKIDTAKTLLNSCLEYFNRNQDEQGSLEHGKVWLYYGQVSHRAQELQLAKNYGLAAHKVFTTIKNQKYIGNALNLLGTVEMSLDDYPSSLQNFTNAYKTKIEGGEPIESCISEIANIALVYWRMGIFDKALEYAHTSLSISKRTNEITRQINSLNTIGSIHSAAGNTDSAYFYFNQCKEKALANKRGNMAFISEYNIANMYSNNGRYAESNRIMKTLMTKSNEAFPGMRDIAQTLVAKNFLRGKKFDSAIITASPLYREFTRKKNRQSAINITEILWQAYDKRVKHDSAFFYLLKHFALKDSVYNIENQRKLSTLYAEMETIEKQAEIEVLEKDKILQKTKNQNLQILLIYGTLTMTMLVVSIVLGYKNREKKQRLLNLELQSELDKNKKTLHQQALRIIYINNGLTEIENSLKKIKIDGEGKSNDVQQILNTIHLNKSLEKEWENFNEYFGNVHGSFITKLNALYPELTTTEKRLASLIKMSLTNREIGSIMNIEPSSVKMAKYRLKKKLQLSDDQDINMYLHNLDQNAEHPIKI